MVERELAKSFDELDVEVRIKILMEYANKLIESRTNTGKLLENTTVDVALSKALKRLEKEMGL